MAYLCVNKDGQELICQSEPNRTGLIRAQTHSKIFGRVDPKDGERYELRPPYSYEKVPKENLSYWEDEENLNMGEFKIDYTIELPKGSIKRLLGRELTWADDFVEIRQL